MHTSTPTSHTDIRADLTQPVDVYSDWIDACDAVAKDQAVATPAMPPAIRQQAANASRNAGLATGDKYTAEDDGFLVDDEEDAEADFADD